MQKKILPIDIKDLGLQQREVVFVGEYCANGYDEVAAAKAARLVPESATTAQCRLKAIEIVNDPRISRAIDRMTETVLNPYRDRIEAQLVKQLQIRAFYDPSWFYYTDGTARPLEEIPTDRRYAIDDVTESYYGKDATTRVVTYKLANKAQAQKELRELLSKKDSVDQSDSTSMRSELKKLFGDVKMSIEITAKQPTALIEKVDENKVDQRFLDKMKVAEDTAVKVVKNGKK